MTPQRLPVWTKVGDAPYSRIQLLNVLARGWAMPAIISENTMPIEQSTGTGASPSS